MGKLRPAFNPKALLCISVVVAAICAAMIPLTNVNADMTKYLPDDSRMKEALEILFSEFDFSSGDALSQGQDGIMSALSGSASQNGNTPPPQALLLAVVSLIVILVIMSPSFLEPVVFLIATGMAVAVNLGTNALLPSVSVTTHSIAAVLQLALSMDYSIILMNRFRQQMNATSDKRAAMGEAIRKASPAILSSSLTTVVGLSMLSFMKLKIGADLGIVLAKGVLCSLLYTYTALPGLILLFYKGIKASEKKVPLPRTDALSSFCGRFRIPLSILFVAVFALSYALSTRTPIKFSTNKAMPADTSAQPKLNAVVVLYENEKEDGIIPILESVEKDRLVRAVYSYPTLMKRALTAPQMVESLAEKARQAGFSDTGMLSEELLRICYYAHRGDKNLKIGFTQLVDFITARSASSPLLSVAGIPDLDEKLSLLRSIRGMADMNSPEPEPLAEPSPESLPAEREPEPAPSSLQQSVAAAEDSASAPALPSAETVLTVTPPEMTVREYMDRLLTEQNTLQVRLLHALSDSLALTRKMTVGQMAEYMNSTLTQTRMVYSFSKNSKQGMTPVEFAHFLTDDLFHRKALSKFINDEQKAGMIARTVIMDAALSGKSYPRQTIDSMVIAYGLEKVLNDSPAAEVASAQTQEKAAVKKPAAAPAAASVPAPAKPSFPSRETAPAPAEDPSMMLLQEMLNPSRKYTATAMARNFRALGEDLDEFTVQMIYNYYGSVHDYNPEWTMTLEELLEMARELGSNENIKKLLGENSGIVLPDFDALKEGTSLLRGPAHSIAAIITDYPDESPETERFIRSLQGDHYLIGESVMFLEMKDGFRGELRTVTLLTILAILTIVALTFKSPLTAVILVMGVMSSVFVNVTSCGLGGGSMLYLAYLIVQSILMGATIDYGILFTTYYREHRSLTEAYNGSIRTILTGGLIICCVPGTMAILLDDAMVQPIVQNLAIGAFAALVVILFIMPGVLALVFPKKNGI